MSTKIYNGYRLPAMSLKDLQGLMLGLREPFEKARIDQLQKLFEPEKYEWSKLDETARRNDKAGLRDFLDFSASVTFFPADGKILAMTFWQQKIYDEIWRANPFVHYYGYWNNVDPDEDCSEAEWEEMEKDWELALPGVGIPSLMGFSMDILQIGLPFRHEIWPNYNPPEK